MRLSRTLNTGAAWLPSVRGLNCSLKWGNERNPCRVLQVSRETAVFHTEEGEDDVKSAWPFDTLGYTHVTMAGTTGFVKSQDGTNPIKPSSVRIGGCNLPP